MIIPPVLNKKIREAILYRIHEILGTENPRVLYGYTSLSSQPWSNEMIFEDRRYQTLNVDFSKN